MDREQEVFLVLMAWREDGPGTWGGCDGRRPTQRQQGSSNKASQPKCGSRVWPLVLVLVPSCHSPLETQAWTGVL